MRPQALLLLHCASGDHPKFTLLQLSVCVFKNKMARELGPAAGVVSTRSPSSGDSQRAAASARDAVFGLVGGGGAGRPGLGEWV